MSVAKALRIPLRTYPALVVVRQGRPSLVLLVEGQALPPGLLVLLPQPLDPISVPATCAATGGKSSWMKLLSTHISDTRYTQRIARPETKGLCLIFLICVVPTGLYQPYFCFLILTKLLIVNLIPVFKKGCPCPKNLAVPVQDKRQQMDADRWGSTRKLLTFLWAAINDYHILIIMMMMISWQKVFPFAPMLNVEFP